MVSLFVVYVFAFGVAVGNTRGEWYKETRSCSVVVVLGAGGDLVKRFVWRSLWNLFVAKAPLAVVATSRGNVSRLVPDLNSGLQCASGSGECDVLGNRWSKCTSSLRLKQDSDYQLMESVIPDLTEACGCSEAQRVFYLAVPPSAYVALVRQIQTNTHTPLGTKLAVALEKPFGRDLSSSLSLAEDLKQWLREDQIVRVDHYLAKASVQMILKFRCENNPILSEILDGQHVERIDVVAKESLTAEGRTGYYDQYGVVRDMVQNHLTQLLTLVAMEIPPNCMDVRPIESNKLQFLRTLPQATPPKTLLGQYSAYSQQVEAEGGRRGSFTPTFAASILEPFYGRWKGTKFVVTSGKGLPHKSTHVHVVFSSGDLNCPKEIYFIIYDVSLPMGVIVSSHFKDLKLDGSPPVELSGTTSPLLPPGCWYGTFPCNDCNKDAYDIIMQSLVEGDRSVFVSTRVLLESWRIWSNLVTEADLKPIIPIIYNASNLHVLEYSPWSTQTPHFYD